MRRLFPEPSAKENLCFSVQSDYISAPAHKVLFPNLPAQQAKLLFSFFQSSVQLVCFFIFSSKDNYNTGRAALQTQIQKGTHMSNTQTDTFRQNTHTNRPCICVYWTILEGDSEIEKDAPLAGKQKGVRKDISVRVCKIFLQRENNYAVNLKEKHSLSRQTLK